MFVPLTLRDFLDHARTVYPDRVAVVDEPDQVADSWGELTYAQLYRRARSQAATLDALGVAQGARVAMVSQNAARLLASFYGVANWGRIFVPVNFRLAPAEIEYIVQHCGAQVVLLDPELEHLAESCASADHVFVLGRDDNQIWASRAEPAEWVPDENATATINYTSGTTARPKGVQQTHRARWINATTFGWHASISDRDVYLHTLPMFHCDGWGLLYSATGMGSKQIVLRQVDGTEILRRIEEHRVTLLACAPAVLNAVLDALPSWAGETGRGRVRCIVAGAPPSTRAIQRVREELGWEFIQIYGLTETSPLLTMSRMREEWDDLEPDEQARLLGRAGAPTMGTRIMTDDHGEILARSNTVLESYWENPEATAEALAGGWFHTGDGGVFEDGYVAIADRKKDVIVSGGENVSSIEVEDILASHPAVREVAVIGVPDDQWGELVLALVVAEGDLTEDDLRAHVRERLAGYKVPKRVEFRDELARTATGKLQKFKLREPYWEGRERQIN